MSGNGTHQPAGVPGVSTDRPGLPITGTGTLLTGAGRGVRNGIPYGQQLEAEELEVHKPHRFRPGAAAALRAATRKALGR